MSSNKNNIFVQLYKPIDQSELLQNTQNTNYPTAPSPELDAFSNTNASEYAPIYEYVEPNIDETINAHIQNSNPQYVVQNQIPLTPTHTASVPGIQPMILPSVPLSDLEIEKELKTDVYNAIRWLAEWCVRQFQIDKNE